MSLIASNSAVVQQTFSVVKDGVISIGALMLSAFAGGYFAGYWSNKFETKRRRIDKRTDRYNEHRNAIVQIEQELIPLRVNISRNIAALDDAIKHTVENKVGRNIRFILRFYKLSFSTGLGLKLLSIDFINDYSQLYSKIEIFNSDIEYVTGMVQQAKENMLTGKHDPSLIESYKVYLHHLKEECEDIDKLTLDLLSKSKVAIKTEAEEIKAKYIEDGEDIKYQFSKSALNSTFKKIRKEEDFKAHPNEKRPKFISPFLDLKEVVIPPDQNRGAS